MFRLCGSVIWLSEEFLGTLIEFGASSIPVPVGGVLGLSRMGSAMLQHCPCANASAANGTW